jgi:hypothetical protein
MDMEWMVMRSRSASNPTKDREGMVVRLHDLKGSLSGRRVHCFVARSAKSDQVRVDIIALLTA